MRRTGSFIAVALALGVVTGVRAQQAPQQPTFRSGVDLVEVTAIVTDRDGNAVKDLTKDDFEILEDGEPREISSFSLVDIPYTPLPEGAVNPLGAEPDVVANDGEPGRLYVITMGAYDASSGMRVRQIVSSFIERHFGPNDVGAVVYIGQTNRKNAQPFTGNRRLLLNAIGGAAQAGDLGPRPMASFRELVESVAKLKNRRKTVLFVSTMVPDAYSVVDFNGGVMSEEFEEVQRLIGAAARGNVTIYTMDPRGLTAAPAWMVSESAPTTDQVTTIARQDLEQRSGMRSLANFTGGFAITSQNDFDGALERLARDNSTYYLLGYVSVDKRSDDRFRPLRVRVKRPGLEVRARLGYVSRIEEPDDQPTLVRAATSQLLRDAVGSATITPGVPLRVFAAPFKASTGRNAVVPIVIEVNPTALGLVEQDGTFNGELEVGHFATDWRNKTIPGRFFVATLKLQASTYERAKGSGLRVLSEARLPPGLYQLRIAATNRADRSGSVLYDLEVPDFSRRSLMMSGVVLSAGTVDEAFLVRQFEPLKDLLPGVPTTAREFTAGDTVTAFAEVYDNVSQDAGRTVRLTAELRTEAGRAVHAVTDQRSAKDLPRPRGGYGFRADFQLRDVAPGRYVIHLEASASTGKPAARDVPITVR